MLFSSTYFLFLFLPIVIFLYYVVFRRSIKAKNILLFISSIFFYAWGEPFYVILLLASIIINYLFGLLVDKFRNNKIKVRFIISFMLIFNLSLIFMYKYYMFFMENINNLFGTQFEISEIALPIGISFFTFQAISYVVDIYRGKGKVQKNLLNVGLYIALFPQLVAGPIVRYETISEQINNRKHNMTQFSEGVCRFIVGLAKKVLISNQMGFVADYMFASTEISIAGAWIGAIAYTLQIYYDFSGYSDMAIGLGKMFGFEFEENFNYPYISKTITEFWRRWHISLSSWFRDYVYIPLGGSRVKTKARLILNLFVVWLLTGVWHGASWNFILWGLYYFVILLIEKMVFSTYIKNIDKKPIILKAFSHILTIILIIIGWVLFRAEDLNQCISYLSTMFALNSTNWINGDVYVYFIDNIAIFIIAIIFSTPIARGINNILGTNKESYIYKIKEIIYPIVLILLFLISVAYIAKGTYNPFIYFNF